MNRTIIFIASLLSFPSRRMTLGLLLVLIISATPAYSQSRDKNNPTRLTSKEIAGVIGDNRGESYYYTFFAGPGELTLTLKLEGGGRPQFGSNVSFISFQLFNEDDQMIGSRMVTAFNDNTEQGVERINFSRRRRVLLRINVSEHNLASAKYWLRLDGSVDVSGTASTKFNLADVKDGGGSNIDAVNEKGNCLPKQGTLIVKMKDGSKKIIDLSEAETVTIVP